jgi:Ca2+-binding RTX toxin-like protein
MRRLIVVAAGAVALASPQAAVAEVDIQTDFDTRSIAVLEDSPDRDRVSLTARPDVGFVIEDSAGIGSIDSPCSRLSATSARCPVLDTTELFFNLAEKRDRVIAELPPERAFFLTDYIYRLGAGNDGFFGAQVAERVSSGIGDDALASGAGDDRLSAGKGKDELDGGEGSDSCNGGGGRDSAANCESVRRIP